jgi:ribokinase
MPRLHTSGGLILDNVVTAEGRLLRGQIGGNALYSAAGAALWIDRVGVIGRVPTGYPLDRIEAAHDGRLDLSGVAREAAIVTHEEWFVYGKDGERLDQLHATPAQADDFGMTGEQVSRERAADFMRHLSGPGMTVAGFGAFRLAHPVMPEICPQDVWRAAAIHLAPNPPHAQLAMAQAARAAGLLVTCDPGHFAATMDEAFLDRLLPLVDAFLPSAREARLLYPDIAPDEAARALARRTRGLAAVKLGAAGSVIAQANGTSNRIVAAKANAVDPTGAGDAWCGGLLAGLHLGDTPADAAIRASVTAAIAVELRGPLPLVSLARSQARLRLAAARSAIA